MTQHCSPQAFLGVSALYGAVCHGSKESIWKCYLLERILKSNYPRCSVVVNYNEDIQKLTLQLVEPIRLAAILAEVFEAPILLDELDFKLDDEFARRFGGSALNLIALGQPEIGRYMTVTQHPFVPLSSRETADGK